MSGDDFREPGPSTTLPYTNWRGEFGMRTIAPMRMFWGSNEWHPEPQWLIEAWDADKGAVRIFSLAGFGAQRLNLVAGLERALEIAIQMQMDAGADHPTRWFQDAIRAELTKLCAGAPS